MIVETFAGKDPAEAVHNAVVLEEVAFMNFHSLQLNQNQTRMQRELHDKHYLRKHGKTPITDKSDPKQPGGAQNL